MYRETQRKEKMIFFKTNDLKSFERTWKKNFAFLLNERFFKRVEKNLKKTIEQTIFKNLFNLIVFTERMILLNERFYLTIVQWENERNRWNINDQFETEQNQYFGTIEK